MRSSGIGAGLAAILLLAGCRKAEPGARVLAKVGDHVITAADLQHHIDGMAPLLRPRYANVERRRELLETLVRNQLLAQEAARRHLERAPAVREQLDRAMTQELLRVEFEAHAAASVGDAAVRRYYDEHAQEFVRPEMARVAHLFLVADARSRPAVQAEAERLRRELDGKGRRDAAAFAAAVQRRSDDPATRASGGALRMMTREELATAVGPAAAQAAFALQAGEIAGPFPTDRGFEIVRLELKSVGVNRPLAEVAGSIRAQIARQTQGRTYEDLIRKIREGTKVTVDEAALAALPLDTSAPPATASAR